MLIDYQLLLAVMVYHSCCRAKLLNGIEAQQAKAVVETLDERSLKEKMFAMSFETTASDTERNEGACVLIVQEPQKNLLYLKCPHHIFERLAQTAFSTTMGSTATLEVLLFKRFLAQSELIDKTSFATIKL